MKLQHPNCQNIDCFICLWDHQALDEILQKKIGSGANKYDLLYEYRNWLIKEEVPDGTKWGWGSPEAFEDINIENFCNWFKENYS